jgi:diguanylate cyclase (GGDEF)-like protein
MSAFSVADCIAANPTLSSAQSIFAQNPQPVAILDRSRHLLWSNEAFHRIFRADIGAVPTLLAGDRGSSIGAMLHIIDRMMNSVAWQGQLSDCLHGEERSFEATISPLPDGDCFLLVACNVTAHLRSLHDAIRAGLHDKLTGLPNRAYFIEKVETEVRQVMRSKTFSAILLIDADGFKAVNDTFGHDAGDEVLKTLSERLRRSIRETDFCARLGGDEFGCVLTNLSSSKDAALVADKVVKGLRHEYQGPNMVRLPLGVSVGVGMVQRGYSVDKAIKDADCAMYVAKAAGKNCWRFPPKNYPG